MYIPFSTLVLCNEKGLGVGIPIRGKTRRGRKTETAIVRQREAREKGNNYATLRGNFQWQMKKRWKLFCERPNHEISSVSCYFLQWAASKLFLLFKFVNSANVCPFVTLHVLAMFGVNLQYSYTSLSATRNILARK